jgi:hypothetical protein
MSLCFSVQDLKPCNDGTAKIVYNFSQDCLWIKFRSTGILFFET